MTSQDTLLIRHLPAELNNEDKKDLLYHFGAVRIKVMGGSMKNCAFATFPDEEEAKKGLLRLHQLKVFGRNLVAEYAKTSHKEHFPKYIDDERKCIKEDKRKSKKENIEIKPQVNETYQKWGIPYCANPRLHYQYPPPTMSVIANIANALVSYPKFYVQVLHLMNKLHLPVPFGNLTQAPPIPYDEDPKRFENLQMEEISSQEESELESDEEQSVRNVQTLEPTLKRPHQKKVKRDWKKVKLTLTETIKLPTSLPAYSASDVFEANPLQQKKILFKLPDAVPENTEETHAPVSASNTNTDLNPTDESGSTGFGKIVPIEKVSLPTDASESQQFKSLQFVSADEIKQGRISSKEMKEFPAFKNYSAGEPSSRLYIKNLSRHVSEEDLWKIFGYYVNWNNKEEKNMFYIRLMQEGRIRGQAFVTLPSEEVAKVALDDTNGFVLHSRPMVVQFARSAK